MSFVGFFFILFTRLIFISPNALFFDSPEYLQSFAGKSLLSAVTGGHLPTHPLFILIGWLGVPISVMSALSGINTCVFLYLLLKQVFGKKTAWFSILLYSFLPYVWISQTNFTIESFLLMFFAGAYYFLFKYFKKRQNRFWLASVFFFTAALLTHFSILVFSVSFLGLLALFGFSRRNLTRVILFIFASLFISVSIYCLLFYSAGILNREVVLNSFINHLGERADLLRNTRNALLILLRSSTLPVLCLSVYGAFILRKKPKKLMFLIIFFLPFLYSSQFWHVGLFGRTSLPALIPLSVFAAVSFKRKKYLVLLLVYLVFSYAPILYRYKNTNQPIRIMQEIQSKLRQGGLYIDSHLSRPFTTYSGEILHAGFLPDGESLQKKIEDYIKEGKPVYIDSFAVFDPYLSYDASTLHILGMGRFGVSDTKEIFRNNYVKIAGVGDSSSRVYVFEIYNGNRTVDKENENPTKTISGKAEPGSSVFAYSNKWYERILKERFDYFDPVSWLWVLITGRREPVSWTYADKGGFFEIPVFTVDNARIFVQNDTHVRQE